LLETIVALSGFNTVLLLAYTERHRSEGKQALFVVATMCTHVRHMLTLLHFRRLLQATWRVLLVDQAASSPVVGSGLHTYASAVVIQHRLLLGPAASHFLHLPRAADAAEERGTPAEAERCQRARADEGHRHLQHEEEALLSRFAVLVNFIFVDINVVLARNHKNKRQLDQQHRIHSSLHSLVQEVWNLLKERELNVVRNKTKKTIEHQRR
jgi:hypothetical protein